MKLLLLITLILPLNSFANKIFIEPGLFMNMMDSANAEYHDGTSHFDGVMRNKDISYAFKFGMHFGHYEIGLESEVYNFVAHLDDDTNGNFTKDVQLTYNSIFIGYEFIPHQFFYLAVSNTPYMSSGGKSFIERHNVLSLEYSYHIKEWVSLNAKVETASELKVKGGNEEKFKFGNLLLVGFSFPLMQD